MPSGSVLLSRVRTNQLISTGNLKHKSIKGEDVSSQIPLSDSDGSRSDGGESRLNLGGLSTDEEMDQQRRRRRKADEVRLNLAYDH